jgi:hypothetical protein
LSLRPLTSYYIASKCNGREICDALPRFDTE